jgi:hypothetical protein
MTAPSRRPRSDAGGGVRAPRSSARPRVGNERLVRDEPATVALGLTQLLAALQVARWRPIIVAVFAGRKTGLALVVAALGLGTMAAETNAAIADKACGSVKTGKQSYAVRATKISCSFADTWAARLAGKRLANYVASTHLKGGPHGYTCIASTKSRSSPFKKLGASVQTAGSCSKGALGAALGAFGNTPYFNWTLVYKASSE